MQEVSILVAGLKVSGIHAAHYNMSWLAAPAAMDNSLPCTKVMQTKQQ
jgi:hypothetical protein